MKERGELGARLGEGAGAGPVQDSYVDHLRELSMHGRAPHVVIVSGDITETGRGEEYEAAKSSIAAVRTHLADHPLLGPEIPRALIAPGNHDVDWGWSLGKHDTRARHRPFAAAFEGFPRPKLKISPSERPVAEGDVLRHRRGYFALRIGGVRRRGGERRGSGGAARFGR